MSSSPPAGQQWLATLKTIVPVPPRYPHRDLNWAAADAAALMSDDFRSLFNVYDTHQFSVEPQDAKLGKRWLRLAGPQPDTYEFSSHTDLWPPIGDRWDIVAVSRSSDAEWASLPIPAVPCATRSWGTFNRSDARTTGSFSWAATDGGQRVTLVVSRQRPEVWVFAMPVAELAVRYLTATTGCPWIDSPPPGDAAWAPHDDIYVPDDEDGLQLDPIPDSHGHWIHGTTTSEVEPAAIEPPSVEVLQPKALDGVPLSADEENAQRDLERLVEAVPPPNDGVRTPDWGAVEELLGGPVREDVRALLDLYGAGTFDADEDEDEDDEADWPITAELRWLKAEYLTLVDDTALRLFDVQDLVGDRPARELRAIVWATIDVNHEDELWLWRVGDRSGIARNSDDHARRLPRTAAGNLEDALFGRGLFGDIERDTDTARHPVTFRPR